MVPAEVGGNAASKPASGASGPGVGRAETDRIRGGEFELPLAADEPDLAVEPSSGQGERRKEAALDREYPLDQTFQGTPVETFVAVKSRPIAGRVDGDMDRPFD